MMNIDQFNRCIEFLFGDLLKKYKDQGEYGFNHWKKADIKCVGYSTNLTPEIIEQANNKNIELILTHHDAWDFVFGMKEACTNKLKQYNIGHFYIHAPLDDVHFGTCNSLFHEIGVNKIIPPSHVENNVSAIGIAEFNERIEFNHLVIRLSEVLQEEVKAWNFGSKTVKRLGMITGAGNGTSYLKSAHQSHCDVYITGEKTLYTIQYAKFTEMNLIVGSHTFTEIFGVRTLVNKLKERFPYLELTYLEEEHLE